MKFIWKAAVAAYLIVGVGLAAKLNADQHWCITQQWGPNALRMIDPMSTYMSVFFSPFIFIMVVPGALAQNDGHFCILGGR